MDFRSLTYFVAAAREKNFTRAAEKLNMSQPPLSTQIRLLEEELGVKLFDRGKKRLELTEAGELLLKRAGQILSLGEKTRMELENWNQEMTGKVHIGLVEGRPPFYVSRWITGFHDEFPLVQFELWNGSSDDVLAQLHRGLVDLALVACPYDAEHLEGVLAGREPWVAMISVNHPLANLSGETIPLRLLAKEPLIIPTRPSRQEAIFRWFAGIGEEPIILCSVNNYINAAALAEQNAGIAIFPQTTYSPNPHLVSRVITDPPRFAEYHLLWEKRQPPVGMAGAFLEYVQDFLEEDRLHSERFRIKEEEFPLPEKAVLL